MARARFKAFNWEIPAVVWTFCLLLTAVAHYFRKWHALERVASEAVGATELLDDDWERIHEQLRQWVRAIEERHPSSSAAILV